MTSTKLTLNSCRDYLEKQLFQPGGNVNRNGSADNVGFIGIEIESFPYIYDRSKGKGLSPVSLYDEPNSLVNALNKASEPYGGKATYRKSDKYNNQQIDKIEFSNGDCFLFEPGGQVEIRTPPCGNIQELQVHLQSCQKILEKVTQQTKIQFGQSGTNLLFDVNEIGNQLQKPRYLALEQYLNEIGPYGKQMMLQTCAMHINIELGIDESTQVKRIVAANLLVPFVTAIFANSNKITADKSAYKAYRSLIWQQLDKTRTGILPVYKVLNSLAKQDIIDLYLSFVLQAPLIYIEELGENVLPNYNTFEYWMNNPIEGISPDITHLENHLSLLFPEVRLRGYIELRSVDAPPVEWQMVPIYFYAGLLYSDCHLGKTLDLLIPYASEIDRLFENAAYGLQYDDVFNVSKKLMELAIQGFSSLPEGFKQNEHLQELIAFSERFTFKGKSFIDG